MTRNLVVCCDGTWNSPSTTYQGKPSPTNVQKMSQLAVNDHQQLVYYHPGVGTQDGKLMNALAAVTGLGLTNHVRNCYTWLATNYQPTDQIFLFGFSRGAYTARALAGLISKCGLANFGPGGVASGDQPPLLDEIFVEYRGGGVGARIGPAPFFNVADNTQRSSTTPIWFVGVWDTVGALGIPRDVPGFSLIDNYVMFEFRDKGLSPNVQNARHAVALDEHRATFVPTLWTNEAERNTASPDSVKQVWFAGAHADVGGGYAEGDIALADCALQWMIEESKGCGLKCIDPLPIPIQPDPMGTLHDSVAGVFQHLPTTQRVVPRLDATSPPVYQHPAVTERITRTAATADPYRPTLELSVGQSVTLTVPANTAWVSTGLYLRAGATYQCAAAGNWSDSGLACDPDGHDDRSPNVSRIADIVGDLADAALNAYNTLLDASARGAFIAKRNLTANWLCLIGVIANGINGDVTVERPNQEIAIGSGTTFSPVADGYFYCYANDSWLGYGNNTGSVTLTVTRTR